MDGNSVNRRLIKLHDPPAKVTYKTINPYAADGRSLFFFSDPPHLIKTTRNCMVSHTKSLWVSYNFNYELYAHVQNVKIFYYFSTMANISPGSISATCIILIEVQELDFVSCLS